MRYEVWALRKGWIPSGMNDFPNYKSAKRFAKLLAEKEEFIDVWIVGREDIKRESYNYW